jgi:DNA-binding MarR family transcriptional regulator
LDKSRVAFSALVFVAATTTLLAGWGVVGSLAFNSPSAAISATVSSESSTSIATTNPANGTQPSQSATTTTASSVSFSGSTTTETSTESSATATGTASSTTTATVTGVATATTTVTASGARTTVTTTVVTTTASATTTSVSTVTAAGSVTTATTTKNSGALGGLQSGLTSFGYGSSSSSGGESLLKEVQGTSLLLAPVAWVLLGGMWVWRGRVRARYSEMGFGSDVFELFMKMKGGATRIKVLNTLSTPKDRLQLAEELGVDWKTVDRHVQILNKYGFVREQSAYGTVRLYEVTPIGKMLLNLFDDLERTDGPVVQQTQASLRSQDERRLD